LRQGLLGLGVCRQTKWDIRSRLLRRVSRQQEWDKSGLQGKTHFCGLGGQAAIRSDCVCC